MPMPMPMTEIAAAPCEAHPALDFGLQPVICIWYDAGCSFGRFEWFRPSKIFGPFSRQRSLHINLWIQPPIRVLIQPVFHSFLATVWMPKATNPACFFLCPAFAQARKKRLQVQAFSDLTHFSSIFLVKWPWSSPRRWQVALTVSS